MDRKQAIGHIAGLMTAGPLLFGKSVEKTALNNDFTKVRHSVCRWPYPGIPLEALCEAARDMRIESVELLDPDDIRTAQKYGLTCAMANQVPLSITEGFNNPQNHQRLQAEYRSLMPQLADLGMEQVICFSGNRDGISDQLGLEHCARGLEPVIKEAEKLGIRVVMELLNSKIDHPNYQCDHTKWGVALCEKIGSANFKLLYDIYHMQIMEGDVIRTIREYHPYISHYHTGGVPGRNELDETQELNYTAIVTAIVETGYTGFIGQEFIPSRDPLTSLEQALTVCTPT